MMGDTHTVSPHVRGIMNAWIFGFLYIAGYRALCLHEIEDIQEDVEKDIQEAIQPEIHESTNSSGHKGADHTGKNDRTWLRDGR